MPLSRLDRMYIKKDRKIRKLGYHCLQVDQSQVRPNEYIKFLDRCISHALKVGDNKIANKLMDESPLELVEKGEK